MTWRIEDTEMFKDSKKRVEEMPLVEFLKLIRDIDLKGHIKYREIVDKQNCPGTKARLEILEKHIERPENESN